MPDGDQARPAGPSHGLRWSGAFAERAEATDLGQLACAVEEFIGRSRSARHLRLVIEPAAGRMFSVRLEPPSASEGTVTVRIPVGTGPQRGALTTAGWAIEHAPSGTRYYTARFDQGDLTSEQVAQAVGAAYGIVYGERARELHWTVRIDPVSVEGSDVPWTQGLRRPGRPRSDAWLAAGVGLVCAWAVLQSFVNSAGWSLASWLVAAVVIGGMACPVALSLTSVPDRLAIPNASFWEGGGVTRAIVAASLFGCASIAWGVALVVLFGARPSG